LLGLKVSQDFSITLYRSTVLKSGMKQSDTQKENTIWIGRRPGAVKSDKDNAEFIRDRRYLQLGVSLSEPELVETVGDLFFGSKNLQMTEIDWNIKSLVWSD
jgi:hypothetical protein